MSPRRAPDVSFEPVILWWDAERPLDWGARFQPGAPVHVEIGCGTGEYLVRVAAQDPACLVVGMEIKWKRAARAARKVLEAGLPNARVLLGDARFVFRRFFAPASLTQVTCLFPDPWPKDNQVKDRLFTGEFLQLVCSRLTADGTLRLITDHAAYADWVVSEARRCRLQTERRPTRERFGTKYERLWRAGGQGEFTELRLAPADGVPPLPREVSVRELRIPSFEPRHFAPRDCVADDQRVAFKEFLYDPERQTALTRVAVVEPDLTQNLWIEIRRRRGYWSVRPSPGSEHVPTAGVRLALRCVQQAARGPATA